MKELEKEFVLHFIRHYEFNDCASNIDEIINFNPNFKKILLLYKFDCVALLNKFFQIILDEVDMKFILSDYKGVREKILNLLIFILNEIYMYMPNFKNAAIFLSRFKNSYIKYEICYKISDFCWHKIEDKSTDYNFYTKRIILSNIFASMIKIISESKDQIEAINGLKNNFIKKMFYIDKFLDIKNIISSKINN